MKGKKILILVLILILALGTSTAFAAEYTVKSGDTLGKIAKEYQVTVDQLVKWNNIANRDLIFVNQKLIVSGDVSGEAAGKAKPVTIPVKGDIDEYGGADAYDNGGDHPDSKYYVNPDIYNMKSDGDLTIISNFKTYQQTSEWSCGNAATLMVLEHFGVSDYTEWDIAVKSNAGVDFETPGSEPGSANKFPEYGTSVDDIVRFFESIDGFDIVETSYVKDYKASELIQEGETGFLVDNEQKSLSEALSALMDDADLRMRMGKSGRELVQQYKPDCMWALWEELIQNVSKT